MAQGTDPGVHGAEGQASMAVESDNVETLREWLAEGSPVRSEHAVAEALVEKLAASVFKGESDWVEHADRVDAYRDDLREWFGNDGGRESQFVKLTGSDADPGALIDWLLPVLVEREAGGARNEGGGAPDGATSIGSQNPNSDGTPGTEFYRFDQGTGEYLYAASADSGDWETYEQRRYSVPTRDDNYGLDYRYDRTGAVYEWYDEAAGTWNDQAWADLHLANSRTSTPAGPDAEPAVEWDENWEMFYRVSPAGVYEFADAKNPGERSSGCGDVWLSQEDVLKRNSSAPVAEPQVDTPEALRAQVRATVASVFEAEPGLREGLTDDDIEAIIKDLAQGASGG